MAILIDENTRAIIQGITGKEGSRAAELMMEYNTNVVAGVTPGKGGQTVANVPVYNSVQETLAHKPNTSFVVVPPLAAKDAVFDALDANIKLIIVFTENVPVHDAAAMIAKARENKAMLIGPASVGVISPGKARIGPVGGDLEMVKKIYKEGEIGIISKSGGMTNETSWVVRQAGLGQSTVIGMGGELLVGSVYADFLRLFEKDPQTKGVVIFGEVGGTYEDQVVEVLNKGEFTKPLAVFIGGKFVEQMPQGVAFGHAGAFIAKGKGKPSEKLRRLKDAGALVATYHHELGDVIRSAL